MQIGMARPLKFTDIKRITCTPELAKEIEGFRNSRRLGTDTEALRVLVEAGLAAMRPLETPADLVAEARKLIRRAIEIHKLNVSLRYGALTGANDPEDALRIVDGLFTDEGNLKA